MAHAIILEIGARPAALKSKQRAQQGEVATLLALGEVVAVAARAEPLHMLAVGILHRLLLPRPFFFFGHLPPLMASIPKIRMALHTNRGNIF